MNTTQNKHLAAIFLGGVLVFTLIYLFFLSAYLPLPKLDDLTAPQRRVNSSTLPIKQQWSYNSDNLILSRPFVASTRVIIRTYNSLIGIDKENGVDRWRSATGGLSLTNVYLSVQGEKLVYASGGDTNLNAVNLETGQLYWAINISNNPNFISSLATSELTAYVGLNRALQPVRGYALTNGIQNWTPSPDLPDGVTPAPLVIINDTLYVFQGSSLHLFDTISGKMLQSLPGFVGDGTSIKVRGNIVYMWYKQALIAKDIQTGQVLWRYNHPPLFYALADDRIVVYSDCCTLATLAASTGEVIWQRELRRRVIAQITILKNVAYVMQDDGSITAFYLGTGEETGRLETSPAQVNYFNKDVGMATEGSCLYATFGDKQLFAFC